jgi:hypothetical protein
VSLARFLLCRRWTGLPRLGAAVAQLGFCPGPGAVRLGDWHLARFAVRQKELPAYRREGFSGAKMLYSVRAMMIPAGWALSLLIAPFGCLARVVRRTPAVGRITVHESRAVLTTPSTSSRSKVEPRNEASTRHRWFAGAARIDGSEFARSLAWELECASAPAGHSEKRPIQKREVQLHV